jgi:hypothetical protein
MNGNKKQLSLETVVLQKLFCASTNESHTVVKVDEGRNHVKQGDRIRNHQNGFDRMWLLGAIYKGHGDLKTAWCQGEILFCQGKTCYKAGTQIGTQKCAE